MLTKLYRRTPEGETCLYVETSEPLTPAELERIAWLRADTYLPDQTATRPFLLAATEIGPRLNVETPFSSNAVAICGAMGLEKVRRMEESRRRAFAPGARDVVPAELLDKMTQQIYPAPLDDFGPAAAPAAVRTIPILTQGESALRAVNAELGLGMDDWDIRFYAELFRRCGRDPTDVELFQIGNANSEHSRHWFWKGLQVIDGREMPDSLLDIVREPLKRLGEFSVSVLAFNDNAGALRGFPVLVLASSVPGRPASLAPKLGTWHVTATAETHNHPTFVAPYEGAETGAGGRIRDNSAAGRGSLPYAGLAGYCVGNLFLPDHPLPGETVGGEDLARYASPLKILVRGSHGVSDYGNRFGEPLIGGFTRTFGLVVNGEDREFRKPVLYSGGIGRLSADHIRKNAPVPGMAIVRIGGPAYRIGVGGGSASSMMQGQNDADLDFNSVQRGNAEMENRANRVIRACIEMGTDNPIQSIHDQGAGGPSNVLTELLEPAGGRIDIRRIALGDRTMSVLEIWSAEYQEGYGLLVKHERLPELQAICERERVNCEVVGEITGDGCVTVVDSENGSTPVRLKLEDILTGMPRKTFRSERQPRKLDPLVLPEKLSVAEALRLVFLLPQVGSKGFLVHKADRSVTGLVARQQCCGPAQIPVADACVTADSHFNLTGAAAAIGEQPIKMLVDPAAGARMAVGEMLTNLASVGVTGLKDVRCRANWMWPAKLPGEGALVYDAAVAMRDLMIAVGIAMDGGKDSLSMAATVGDRIVKSPGQLVILGYAAVPDIRQAATPDLKRPGSYLGFVDLGQGKYRLGGSSLAQAFGQVGNDTPDVDDPLLLISAFRGIQYLLNRGLILAYHDRSDGGLITAVSEMCLAGKCGASLDLAEPNIPALFSEELGMVFEYLPQDEEKVRDLLASFGVAFTRIGRTSQEPVLVIRDCCGGKEVFAAELAQLHAWWEETSFRLEGEQRDPLAVFSERKSREETALPEYSLTFTPNPTPPELLQAQDKPKVAVLREEGTNGDREMSAALYLAGLDPWDITMSDLLAARTNLDGFQGLVFPGGFSFMDVFESAKGWAGVIRFNPLLREMFDRFYARPDTFSLGVCNGCQLMALLGWVPWRGLPETLQPRFIANRSGRFESRWVQVRILDSPAILFRGMAGSTFGVWVAHGEGQLFCPQPDELKNIRRERLAPLRYVDVRGRNTEDYPANPNGSPDGITALCSRDGRHLAMMPHPERAFLPWQWPWLPLAWQTIPASPWLRMFQNAHTWCLAQRDRKTASADLR